MGNPHCALGSVVSFSPPETEKGRKHGSWTLGRAGCALGGTLAPEGLACLICWPVSALGSDPPSLTPLFMRLPGYSKSASLAF